MTEVSISMIIVGLCALFEYGSLLLAGKQKAWVWKMGIYTGMATSGLAGFGFWEPSLNPWPWLTFGGGNAFMLGSVLYSYFALYPIDTPLNVERKYGAVREMSIGFCFIIALSVAASLMQGKQANDQVSRSIDHKLNTIQQGLNLLTATVVHNGIRLAQVETKQDRAAHQDSLQSHRDSPAKQPAQKPRPPVIYVLKKPVVVVIPVKIPWWKFWKTSK